MRAGVRNNWPFLFKTSKGVKCECYRNLISIFIEQIPIGIFLYEFTQLHLVIPEIIHATLREGHYNSEGEGVLKAKVVGGGKHKTLDGYGKEMFWK